MWSQALQNNRLWRVFSAAIFSLLLLAGVAIVSAPAHAQSSCGPREAVLELLHANYAESTVAIGLASSGGVIEVLAAEDGRTWTILLTMPDGNSCVVATGEAWLDVILDAKGQIS